MTRREAKERAARAAREAAPSLTSRIVAPVLATAMVTAGAAASLVGLPAKLADGSVMSPAALGVPALQVASSAPWQLTSTSDGMGTRGAAGASRSGLERLPLSWGAVVAEGQRAMSSRADAIETSLGAGIDITDSGVGQMREIASAHAFHEPILGATRTSGYGWRWGRMHNGLDFGADIGTPLYAVARGTVTTATWNSGLGYHVKITLDTGELIVYGHMSRITASVGDSVEAGTVLGEVGSTGRSTGAHLHFEVRTGDGPIDPASWLAARQG
ncbi:MAG TPA: M23 family metallopeptidase [Ornithinicoccus sp.]|nr:M23 family metallopeptidase [Ornithinicoccus sp.]